MNTGAGEENDDAHKKEALFHSVIHKSCALGRYFLLFGVKFSLAQLQTTTRPSLL